MEVLEPQSLKDCTSHSILLQSRGRFGQIAYHLVVRSIVISISLCYCEPWIVRVQLDKTMRTFKMVLKVLE